MNSFALVFGLAALFLASQVHGQVPQEPPYFTPGDVPAEVDVNWSSVPGRTYFMQFSLDMTLWHYAPYIEYGDGELLQWTVSADADGAIFYRLQYTDAPLTNPAQDPDLEDFDGDGIGNLEEITNLGTNPLNPDTDGDYSPDGEEVAMNTNPLSSRSAPLTLLPTWRRLEMSFTWNGTQSLPATYRHGLMFYEDDPIYPPWGFRHVNADLEANGLPVFENLHEDLAAVVPSSFATAMTTTRTSSPTTGLELSQDGTMER